MKLRMITLFAHLIFFVLGSINVCSQVASSKFTQVMKDKQIALIREAASHAWAGYMEYAKGYDDLKPLTLKGRNWYPHSLLMTPVDAWDTFTILGLKKEASEAKGLVLTGLDFDVDNEVQVFEITIRQLGALITAYEHEHNIRVLQLAKDLADRLMPAFNTPTGMPYRYVHLQTGKIRDSINNPAEIGTLLLEFGQLSKITGDNKYFAAAKRAVMEVYKRRGKTGLPGEQINVITGEWKSTATHISGYIDSYYEYLYKGWLLFGDEDFHQAFETHAAAIKKHLFVNTPHGLFMKHANMNTGELISYEYGALDAFYAGLLALSGDVEAAKKNQAANYYMWTHFNVEPEAFDFMKDTLMSAYYILRPENIESCYYLYRLTKDDRYLFEGRQMVSDILQHCRTPEAFASLKNVKTFEQHNSMESFFFGETLKYAYLLFAPEKTINLKKQVFNTEAHLFNIKKK
ncbi:MAG: glycoside hydrolase family 47 protein [Ferruginibacter sp.]